jgi:hypothetical protein
VTIEVRADITDTDVTVTVSIRSQQKPRPVISRDLYSYSLIHALMSRVHVDPAGPKLTLQKTVETPNPRQEAPDEESAAARDEESGAARDEESGAAA